MKTGENRCENCRWWSKTVHLEPDFALCVRRAPTAAPDSHRVMFGWPVQHKWHWCGEFDKAPKE